MGCRRMGENQGTVVNLGHRMSRAGGSQSFMIHKHHSLACSSLSVSHSSPPLHTLTLSPAPHPHSLPVHTLLHLPSFSILNTQSYLHSFSILTLLHTLTCHTFTLSPSSHCHMVPNFPLSRRESETANAYQLNLKTIGGNYTFIVWSLTHTH